MSDPLSLAASIAGLISLADVTFKYTYKFVRAAKDAKTDVSALADEINNLGSVLRVLEALASDMEAEGDQFDPTLRNHYLNHCFKALSRIEMKTKKAIERFVRSKVDYLNAQKQQVLNYFMKADPQDNLATSIKLRHSMTGLWLTESTDFVRWIETPGSKLWLTGIPGAGKTVLAGSVIQEALSRSYANHSIAVAFFFCDYKDPKTWETVNILGAIANQLARQGKEAFEILSLYYDDLHPPDQFITIPDQDEVRARISQMSHLFDQTIIIIDGLDECGDHTDDVVDTLMQMTEDSENTSLAVFSRDHYNIRVHLETDFDIIPIIARTDDIQLFRWVVCQLDYLCDCAHDEERREALNKLPPDLPESYRRLLERVNRCSPRVQDMVKKCLHFLTINDAKLTIGELRQAISAPTRIGETLNDSNTVTEQEILRRCSSLIRKSTDGNHFDRSAVFSSPGLEKYWISWNSTCALFSTQCLLFLQMAKFNAVPIEFEEVFISNISDLTCQIKETYPFYKHAATWWLRNTKDGLDNSAVLTLVQSLFNPSKRVCFVLWAVEVLQQVAALDHILSGRNSYEEACRIVIQSSFRPLHMAAALNISEICGSLLLDEQDPNRRFETANYLDLAFISVLGIPGMPHLSAEKSKEYWRVRNAVELFLPSFGRRNKTIDCLIAKEAQPSSHRISQCSASVLSITCVLAATYNNLSPITKFLSLNTTPTLSEIKVLGHWINTAEPYDKPAELSA
ncbi:unnamed protein product [Fusarium graminearum]|uniref:Nephrocystin 3-like N-terminal domain-containing protein n=1 Tax=Gibberella zeae TaxID=5518 RepID=A0A4E9EKY5_GIBZA|nr:unnamed protein product [Fusarium graminearum]